MKYLLLFFPLINIIVTVTLIQLREIFNSDRQKHADAMRDVLKAFKGGVITTNKKIYKTNNENIIIIKDCSYCLIDGEKVKYYSILKIMNEDIK